MTTTREDAPPTATQGARMRVRVMLLVGEQPYVLGETDIASGTPELCTWLAQEFVPPSPVPLAAELRERLATLCARLGVADPAYDQLGANEALVLLARLEAEEEELLYTALHTPTRQPEAWEATIIDKALIRRLKERWRTRFCPHGRVDALRAEWEQFKQRVCGQPVSDRAMRPSQYERLLAALQRERKP
jgi:hypothetical protein